MGMDMEESEYIQRWEECLHCQQPIMHDVILNDSCIARYCIAAIIAIPL